MDTLVAFILLIGVLIFGVVITRFVLRRAQRAHRSRDFRMDDRQAWAEHWKALEQMLDDNPVHWPSAIIEADKLFDSVLKSLHLPGQDTGERFRFLMRDRPQMKYVRSARFIRNRVVHESSFQLTKKMAHEAIVAYRRALKDLGVL